MRGWTPLHYAVQSGNVDSLRLLLDAGADPNGKAPGGQNPLTLAAESLAAKRSAAVIRLLLERGASVHGADMQGETALHKAARAGHLETAKLLIEAGADLHARLGVSVPGVSEEMQRRMQAQMPEMMQEMLSMFGGMATPDPDADAPPPPDTSTVLGEKLAQARDALQQRLAGMADRLPQIQERMRDMMEGGFGRGRSAAQAATDSEAGREILPELERLAAAKQGQG
jgi:hypothetical protein